MASCSAGYIVAVADRLAPVRGVRLRVTRHAPGKWLARARRLRRGRLVSGGIRLRDARYLEDVNAARATLEGELGTEFALTGRAPWPRAWRVLSELVARDRKTLAARFDPATRLLRSPGGRLPRPVAKLADDLAAALRAAVPEGSGRLNLFLRAYGLGLVWRLLKAEAETRGIPGIYVPELFRALMRRLANRHLSDVEMAPLLRAVAAPGPEFRVAAWEDAYFARRLPAHPAQPARTARLGFYLAKPRDAIERGIAHYRRRTRAAIPVRAAAFGVRVMQLAGAAAAALGAGAFFMQGAAGLVPGLLVLFTSGAAVSAWRLYRLPDFAASMGHVALADLRSLEADLKELHPHTLEPVPLPATAPVQSRPGPSVTAAPVAGTPAPPRPAPGPVKVKPRDRAPSLSFAPPAPQKPPTRMRHATPLDPTLPSVAFWGVDAAGLPAGPVGTENDE